MADPITYVVAVDWDDDGDFDDPGEDITADVLALSWRLGLAAPFDAVAAPSWAQITVRNAGRDYSPERTARRLPGKWVRVQCRASGVMRTHFTGCIERVEPLPGDWGARTAALHVAGPERQLERCQARLPPQPNARAGDLIAAVLDAALVRPLALAGRWLLGEVGQAELGVNTRLPAMHPRSLEAGQSVFAYAAELWGDGVPALAAIRQLAESERGRFYTDRDGRFVLTDRHHTLRRTAAAAVYADDMAGLAYQFGAGLANRVQVRLIPRGIGAAGSALWTLEEAQRLPPGAWTVWAGFRDANRRPAGALAVTPPAPGVDYRANALPDGSGADRTGQVAALLVETTAAAARLEFRNSGPDAVYLLAGARLRGTPIILGDAAMVEAADGASEARFGAHPLLVTAPALSSLEEAANVAQFELARRKAPRGRVHSLHLSGQQAAAALARTLFDRITVREAQTGHAADYLIIAEEHRVDLGGARHRIAWLLEPADGLFWMVDAGRLDESTALAY